MSIESHLPSTAELLYHHQLYTRIPWSLICGPHVVDVKNHFSHNTDNAKFTYASYGLCGKIPIYARQSISVWSDAKGMWVPATDISHYQYNSFLITVYGDNTCQLTCNLLMECCTDTSCNPENVFSAQELHAVPPAALLTIAATMLCTYTNNVKHCP